MNLLEIFNPKAKEEFEKWYLKKNYVYVKVAQISLRAFYKLPFSFQQGVILEWLREQGIHITYKFLTGETTYEYEVVDMRPETFMQDYDPIYNEVKFETLLQAIEKAVELI